MNLKEEKTQARITNLEETDGAVRHEKGLCKLLLSMLSLAQDAISRGVSVLGKKSSVRHTVRIESILIRAFSDLIKFLIEM